MHVTGILHVYCMYMYDVGVPHFYQLILVKTLKLVKSHSRLVCRNHHGCSSSRI